MIPTSPGWISYEVRDKEGAWKVEQLALAQWGTHRVKVRGSRPKVPGWKAPWPRNIFPYQIGEES